MMNRIKEFNQIVEELKTKGYCTAYNFQNHYTEIYTPGDFKSCPQVIGYITKKNEIIYF